MDTYKDNSGWPWFGCNLVPKVDYFIKSSEFSEREREIANKLFKKKKHNKEIHQRILFKYSKSAALAPLGSEELSKSLNNRSIFLIHLKKYSNSLKDIDYALSITKSEVLMSKLLCRKVQCLLAMNQKDEGKTILNEAYKSLENMNKEDENVKIKLLEDLKNCEKLFEENKSYKVIKKGSLELDNDNGLPYISKAVSFNYDQKFGKHLLANRDISTGEILIVEKPYCIYPELGELYTVCSHCLKFTYNSIPCKTCVFAVYCSKNCQREAFEEYHDIECLINPMLFENSINKRKIFFSRLFIKLIKGVGVENMIEQAKVIDDCRNDERISNFVKDKNDNIKNYNAFKFYYDILSYSQASIKLIKESKEDTIFLQFFLKLLKTKTYYNKFNSETMSILKNIFLKLMYNTVSNDFELNRESYKVKKDEDEDEFEESEKIELESSGMALTQLASLINHNCFPNASKILIDGAKFVVFANRPIKKFEQVYITYGPWIGEPKEHRNEVLMNYGFECNCKACTNNWPQFDIDMQETLSDKILLNKNKKYDNLKKLLEEYTTKSKEVFDEWMQDNSKFKIVCQLIDKCYSINPSFEEVFVIDKCEGFLRHFFSVFYNDDFEIPEDC